MKNLPQYIENQFFKFLNKEISIEEFEQWVYATDELETVLSADMYQELIAFNYNARYVLATLFPLLMEYLNESKFEKYRIIYLLELIVKDDFLWQNTVEKLFDECVNRYNFLDAFFNLGFVIQDNKSNEKLMEEVHSLAKIEALRVLKWLNSEKIIILGSHGHRKGTNFSDSRTKQEKDLDCFEIAKLKTYGINKSRYD